MANRLKNKSSQTAVTEPIDNEHQSQDPKTRPTYAGITPRAFIIGLILIPILIFWLEYTEIIAAGPDLAAMSLPMAVLFALLLIIPINLLIKRWKPKAALSQAELLFIYLMNTTSIGIGGIGMMQFLTPQLVGWSYFNKPGSGWDSWQHLIRNWAVPSTSVVEGYYNGKTTFFTAENIIGWSVPIIVWTGFIFVLLFCMYCVSTIIRRQWVDRERLIFPIVQIPMEITQDGGNSPIWRSKLLWAGVLVPVILESMAAIHFTLLPTFPYVPLKPEASLFLHTNITSPPWSAIGYTTLAFYPLVIGLTFLLSSEVSFSCWFFYLLTKVENVAATAMGFRDPGAGPAMSRLPYTNEQGLGAFIGLALFSLYFARPHLREAWRKAFCNDKSVDDSDEPMSYRTAFIGLFVSGAVLVAFGTALGLSLLLSVLFFGMFFLLALTYTRIRAEVGLPWGHGPAGLAHENIIGYVGTQSFSTQQLTAFSFTRWFDADWRCLGQPSQLEAMKMGSSASPQQLNPRHITAVVMISIVVASLAAWISCLAIYYHYGATSAYANGWRTDQGHYGFDALQSWLNNPKPIDTPRIGGAAIGLAIVTVLSILRASFVWWPLHPIGYAVGNTDTMTWIWFPTLLGWACKSLIVRYGGIKAYRQALPFFLGLILGDYAISGILALIFLATGQPGYRTFPI